MENGEFWGFPELFPIHFSLFSLMRCRGDDVEIGGINTAIYRGNGGWVIKGGLSDVAELFCSLLRFLSFPVQRVLKLWRFYSFLSDLIIGLVPKS